MLALLSAVVVPLVLMAGTAPAGPAIVDPGIEGVWAHGEKPAWIAFSLEKEKATATVVRHEQNPEVVGLVLIEEIEATSAPGVWAGRMFDGGRDAFVPVTLTLEGDDTLIVTARGEAGRPTEVLRLARRPSD